MKAEVPAPQNQISSCARERSQAEISAARVSISGVQSRHMRGCAMASRNVAQRSSVGARVFSTAFMSDFTNGFGDQEINASASEARRNVFGDVVVGDDGIDAFDAAETMEPGRPELW